LARLLQGPLATHAARAAALGRRLAAPLQHDHAAGCVPTSWLWPRRSPPTTRDLRGVLLHSGALLQGTLDLLERAALNPTGETLKPQNKTPSPLGRRAWTTRKLAFAIVIVIIAVLVTVII
jgi:hypothetical protein